MSRAGRVMIVAYTPWRQDAANPSHKTRLADVMTVVTTRKRALTIAAVACLALVAMVLLFRIGGGPGGGGMSFGETSVQYVSVSSDGHADLVVWSDLAGPASQGGDSGLFGAEAAGSVSAADGRRVDWEWKEPAARGGAFRINGTPYDLADGTLFLVSTNGGQVRVTQLDFDLSGVRPDKHGFEGLAEKEPRVAQFDAAASRGK
jgi:hypothetical protein